MYSFEDVKQNEYRKYKTNYPKQVEAIREYFFEKRKDTEEEQFLYSFGGGICAPLYVGFCEWVLVVAQQENIKKIFPLMREGLLYSRILKKIIKEKNLDIKVIPIWISRQSSYEALCYDKFNYDYFKELCFGLPNTIEGCFKKLGIEEHKDIYQENSSSINDSIRKRKEEQIQLVYEEIVRRGLEVQINEKIQSKKQIIAEYLTQCGATEDFITMDCGTLGTLPQAIDNCLPEAQRKIHLFLKAEAPVVERRKKGHDIRYLFFKSDKSSEQENTLFLLAARYFFETITMGNLRVGTAIGYSKENGVICVDTASLQSNEAFIKRINIVQEGILDFCTKYMEIQKNIQKDFSVYDMVENGAKSFARLINYPLWEEAISLSNFEYDENALEKTVKLVSCDSDANGFFDLPEGSIEIKRRENKLMSIWGQAEFLIRSKSKERRKDANRTVAIYGGGDWGKRVIAKMMLYNVEIKCIIDKKLAGTNMNGYPVISIDELSQYEVDDVIIASIDYEEEMTKLVQDYSEKTKKKYVIHNLLV